jgi:HD-GYP domain-containing protein (c-di-GMP phosphodiesterase class II)
MAERLEPILQEGLSGEGFSQYEIDITAKEVIYEYKKLDGTINFSKAVNRAAEALNFDDERRNKLSIAVLKSAAQSVEITFDQWNQCLNYRVKTMSQCVQDIAQDLSRSVAAVTGQSLLGEERSKILNLSKQAMADAVKQCEITAEEADRVLRVVLSDCP